MKIEGNQKELDAMEMCIRDRCKVTGTNYQT